MMDGLDIVSVSDIYTPEKIKECEKRCSAILSAIKSIEKNFEKIAFNLYWIYSTGMYKAYGFYSIIDYAASAFGFSKSTTYNYISLVERFGKCNGEGIPDLSSSSIKKEYKDYSVSQLLELADLSDDEIQEAVVPSMSVRDIKKMVKAVKKSRDEEDSSGSTEPDGQEVLTVKDNELILPDSGDDEKVCICSVIDSYSAIESVFNRFNTKLFDYFRQHPDLDRSKASIEIYCRYPV